MLSLSHTAAPLNRKPFQREIEHKSSSSLESKLTLSSLLNLAKSVSHRVKAAFYATPITRIPSFEESNRVVLAAIKATQTRLEKEVLKTSTQTRLRNRLDDLLNIQKKAQEGSVQIIGIIGWGKGCVSAIERKQGVSQYDSIIFRYQGNTYVEQIGSSYLGFLVDSPSSPDHETSFEKPLTKKGALYLPKNQWVRVDNGHDLGQLSIEPLINDSPTSSISSDEESRKPFLSVLERGTLRIERVSISEPDDESKSDDSEATPFIPKQESPKPVEKPDSSKKLEAKAEKVWYGFQYAQATKYILQPLMYLGASAKEAAGEAGGIIGLGSRAFGLMSCGFQYAQGHFQSKQSPLKKTVVEQKTLQNDSYITRSRAIFQIGNEVLNATFLFVKELGLGVAGSAFSIVSNSISIVKFVIDIRRNATKSEALEKKEAPSVIETATIKQLKQDSLGQKFGIAARSFFISGSITSIVMIGIGVIGVAALASNPIGLGVLVTLVTIGVLLHLYSTHLRLQAKAELQAVKDAEAGKVTTPHHPAPTQEPAIQSIPTASKEESPDTIRRFWTWRPFYIYRKDEDELRVA